MIITQSYDDQPIIFNVKKGKKGGKRRLHKHWLQRPGQKKQTLLTSFLMMTMMGIFLMANFPPDLINICLIFEGTTFLRWGYFQQNLSFFHFKENGTFGFI